jgi:hypothetical protein
MPDCCFKRLQIWHMLRGGTQICWELAESSTFFKGRYHFFVDYGNAGTDEWIALNEEPIVDDCCYYDPCRRTWDSLMTGYYRVRLVLPDEPGCPVCKSEPARADLNLPRTAWLQARQIIRLEYLQQRHQDGVGEGSPGLLLKRKKFGQACPRCLDWDTKEITDSSCPICYGTGIVGGYYPGIEYWVTFGGGLKRRLDFKQPSGVTSNPMEGGRVIMYPHIDTRDIWVDVRTDRRWLIDSYQVIASFRGLDLIAQAKLHLIQANDIAYGVPVDGTPASSSSLSSESSESGEVQCDVTRGLDASYNDW